VHLFIYIYCLVDCCEILRQDKKEFRIKNQEMDETLWGKARMARYTKLVFQGDK